MEMELKLEVEVEVDFVIGVAGLVVCRRVRRKPKGVEDADMSWREGMVKADVVVKAAMSSDEKITLSLIVPSMNFLMLLVSVGERLSQSIGRRLELEE